MKTTIYSLGLFVLLVFASCTKEDEPQNEPTTSQITLTKDAGAYEVAASNRTPTGSDPFELTDVIIDGDSVEFTVAYSGGCQEHTFEVIWNETISSGESPGIDLIIKHDAHGDNCEAYITETLSFPLSQLLDTLSFEGMEVIALNGGNATDSVYYETPGYDFGFTESDNCTIWVTAQNVICGTGLYGNLWFALDDSISAGVDNYYFRKYLQPMAIHSSITGFVPVAGKRYRIGARKDTGDYFSDIPVCLAYPGPSVPIRIMCIQEEN